ncbi:hypothetical protein ABPG77_007363 [Micractinium sp. CCAP 211/92]
MPPPLPPLLAEAALPATHRRLRVQAVHASVPALVAMAFGGQQADTLGDYAQAYLLNQLVVMQRMGRLVEEAELRGTGAMQQLAARAGLQWRLADALGCLDRRRLRRLRLWSENFPTGSVLTPMPVPSGFCNIPSLPATAAKRIGRLRRLGSLDLSSWQLPASLVPALGRLTALRALSLRARHLPPGCFEVILSRLTGLTSLAIKTTKDLGPLTVQLTQLQQLRSLQLVQLNSLGVPLLPPALDLLPCLERCTFYHERGQVMVAGGGLHEVHVSKSGHAGGAALELGFVNSDPPVDSLQRLLDSLLPPGVPLRRLKASAAAQHAVARSADLWVVKLMSISLAALQPCSHLSSLQALELTGLRCEDGDDAALAALLRQARGLTQLEWSVCSGMHWADGARTLPDCLAEYGGLRRLSLTGNALADLPPGCAFLPTIEELHLQHNRFKRLPFAVAAASRLRVLRLEGNQGLQLGPAEVVLLTHLPALQELDLRGTKACEWPADLARLARRPGLELRLDAPPHDREDDNIYAAEYSFHVDDGLPWEVERREQRAAMEASWRQAEGQQAAQPNVAQPIAALAALEVQLQALHAMHLAAQDLAQAAGQPWQPPAVDALQRAQQWAHFGQRLQHLLGLPAEIDDPEQQALQQQQMAQALAGMAVLLQEQQQFQDQLQQQLAELQELQQLQELQ